MLSLVMQENCWRKNMTSTQKGKENQRSERRTKLNKTKQKIGANAKQYKRKHE